MMTRIPACGWCLCSNFVGYTAEALLQDVHHKTSMHFLLSLFWFTVSFLWQCKLICFFRYYIETIVKYMKEEKLVLKDLFAKVREDLSQRQPRVSSLPLEFSLTSSLLPLCLNQGWLSIVFHWFSWWLAACRWNSLRHAKSPIYLNTEKN